MSDRCFLGLSRSLSYGFSPPLAVVSFRAKRPARQDRFLSPLREEFAHGLGRPHRTQSVPSTGSRSYCHREQGAYLCHQWLGRKSQPGERCVDVRIAPGYDGFSDVDEPRAIGVGLGGDLESGLCSASNRRLTRAPSPPTRWFRAQDRRAS
jgi:hypothetical protein